MPKIPWNKGLKGITLTDAQKVSNGWGKIVTCENCKNKFYKQNNQVKSNNFCNRECYHSYRKGQDLGGWVTLTCENCDKSFKKRRHQVKGNLIGYFCEMDCYQDYKAVNGNTPFTIGKTTPEKKVADILDNLSLDYTYNKLFRSEKYGRCYYDFYIPSKNLVIEVDGDYWHGNPNIYKTLNKQQIKSKERDLQKENLLKDLKIKLLRVWQSQINSVSFIKEINLTLNTN